MDESVDIQALKERIETRLAQLGISSRKASLKTGRGTELIRKHFSGGLSNSVEYFGSIRVSYAL